MNSSLLQPFGLSIEVTWILGILVPMLGWFTVFLLNKNHLRHEKSITIKIHAFDYIKDYLNNLIKSGSELTSFIFITGSTLKRLTLDNALYTYNKEKLITDFVEEIFIKSKDKFVDSFSKFVFAWEQYEIVFKGIVIQRYALQEEFKLVLNHITDAWADYHRYMFNLKSNTPLGDDYRVNVINSLENMYTHLLDFTACIGDVNLLIQDHVFGKVLKILNDKRVVKDASFLTIDTLIVKHVDILYKYYRVKNKKLVKTSRK